MSGPTAAIFTIEGAAVIAAAGAIAAAAALAEGLAEEKRQAIEQRQQRLAERQARRAAAREAEQVLYQRSALLRARENRLSEVVRQLVARGQLAPLDPAPLDEPPPGAGRQALQAHIVALEQRLQVLNAHLAAASGALPDFSALLSGATSAADQLEEWSVQAGLFGVQRAAARRATALRILDRLELPPEAPLPSDLDRLAGALIAAPNEEEAQSLASELRLAVQRHHEATSLAARQQQEAEAAALVLEESLRDLGYQVEDIAATLFVEGGMAHFRRADWADYHVRLRIDPARGAINFNVVRPKGEASRHEDILAEDRWCAEFPRLLQTLAARGVKLQVTRQLAAGEAPVQQVDESSLPQWLHEKTHHRPQAAPRRLAS